MIRSLRRGPIIVAFILTVAMVVTLSCGRAFAYMRELQVTTPTAESPAAVKPGGTFLVSGRLQADSGDVLDLEVSIDGIVIPPYYEDIAVGGGIGNWVPFEKEVTLPEDESEGLKNLRIRVYVDDPQRPGLSVEAKALLVDDTKPSAPENITVSPSSQSTEKRPTWSWDPSTDPDIEDQDDGTVSGSGVAKYEVRYKKVDSTEWNGPIEVTSGTSWTPDFDFDDGVWEIEVTAIDGAGNRSDTTTGGEYHLDTVGPVFSNAYPEDGLETNETDIVFEIEISDGDDGVGVAPESIEWSIAPDVDGQDAWDDATSTSTFTPSGSLAEGIYSLSVTASDKVGNSSAYPVAPTTWSFLVDLTDPECKTIGLVDTHRTIDGHVFTNSNTTAITATVIDPGTAPSGFNDTGEVKILVYSDEDMTDAEKVGGTSTPASRPAGNSDSWSVTWTPESALADGDYYVKVRVVDDAGNEAEFTEFSFTVDTTAPPEGGEAYVGSTNKTNSRRFTNDRTVTVTWGATSDPDNPDGSNGSGLLGYTLEIWTKAEDDESPQGQRLYVASSDSDTYGSHTLSYVRPTGATTETWSSPGALPFESGKSYGAWLKAWDRVHNESDWFDPPFIFDNDAPTVPGAPDVQELKDPVEDRRIADNRPELQWTHSTDAADVSQSGVAAYQVQVTRQGTTTWDVLDVIVDIDDEDVDMMDDDQPLDGVFSWIMPIALPDGWYEVRVRALDVAGNYSEWAEVAAFGIDTTPPPVPGMPTTDSPTNDTTPTWTWAWDAESEPDDFSHFNVYLDGVKVNEDDEVKQPTYTIPDELALSDGLHVLQVTAVDDLGNESEKSAQGHIVVDTVPPAIPVVRSLPEYTNAEELTVEWTAVPTAHSYKVEYAIGSNGGTTLSYVPSVTISLAGAVEGDVVEVRVMAIDEAGNESEYSEPVSTIFDDIPPVVTFNAMPSRTRDARPQWQWSATYSVAPVEYYWVSLDIWPAFQTISDRYSHGSDLSDGPHTLAVIAVDAAGNWSTLVWSTVEVDTTVSVPGMPTTASPTNNTKPTWTWPAVTDEDLAHYRVYLDGEFIGTVESNVFTAENYVRDGEPFELSDGLHVTEVTAVDRLGNESARSEQGHVLIDALAPPKPEMDSMPMFSKPDELTFSWSVSDDDLEVKYVFEYVVGYDPEGVTIWTPVPGLTKQSYTVTVDDDDPAEVDGLVVAARVSAYDAAGNSLGFTEPVMTTIDALPPTVTLLSPSSEVRDKDATPTWRWSAVDSRSGVYSYLVTLAGGLSYEVLFDEENTEFTEFTPAPALTDGDYYLTIQAVDNVGNVSDPYTFPKVTVDTTPPPVPGMPTTDSPTNDTTPTWTWAWDAESEPDDFSHFNVYLDGVKVNEDDEVKQPTYTIPDELALSDGLHVLQVTAVDDLGNESYPSPQGHVRIDIIAPEIPELYPMPEYSRLTDITFAWSPASDDLRVDYEFQYRLNDGAWQSVLTRSEFYTIPAGMLADGDRVYARVRSFDLVGNSRGFSDEVQVIIDDTGPVTEFTAPTADVRTNHTQYLWTWESTDAGIGVVVGYWVNLDDQPAFYVTEPKYIPQVLLPGDHRVTVRAVDALGNEEEPKVSPVVTVVEPVVIRVTPSPETYTINQISTIAFEVAGMIDADFVIAIGDRVITGDPEHGWRVVEISKTEAYSKYYLLLDGELLRPGQLLINVRAGLLSAQYIYDVLNERSGFGFGRLRPW